MLLFPQVPKQSAGVTITKKGEKFKSGPFKEHGPGQVCLRCIFCAPHLTDDEKGSRNSRGFPTTMKNIEQYVRNYYRTHLKTCPHIPAKVNDLVKTVRNANARAGNTGHGKYYPQANQRLNLVDDADGTGFSFGEGGMKFADGTTWADRGYGDGPGLRPIPTGAAEIVPIAAGAEVARSGSTTIDIDVPFVPTLPSKSAPAETKKKGRKKRSEPCNGTGTKGRKPKKAKVIKNVESEVSGSSNGEMAMAPFVSDTSDAAITIGGVPPSFFGGFNLFGGIGESFDPFAMPLPAAISPPQQHDFHVPSQAFPQPVASNFATEPEPAPEPIKPTPKPKPKQEPKPPVIRKSRSGRVSKKPNWDDFATDEADIEDRISGAELRDIGMSRLDSSSSPAADALEGPAVTVSGGKTLSAYKTPKKDYPDGEPASKNEDDDNDDDAWYPGMPRPNAATVTPTPTSKAKSKGGRPPKKAKKKPKGKGKRGGLPIHRTFVKKSGMQTGKWTEEEESRLIEAMKELGRNWHEVAQRVGTRTPVSLFLIIWMSNFALFIHPSSDKCLLNPYRSLSLFALLRRNARARTRRTH